MGLELGPRRVAAVVYRRRPDGRRVREDVDALAAAAVEVLPARRERGRQEARAAAAATTARVAVREVPEAPDLGGVVVAPRRALALHRGRRPAVGGEAEGGRVGRAGR